MSREDGARMEQSEERLRILVADDDTDFLEVLELWLAEYDDPEVITVTDGKQALDVVDSSVNVFLCDRRMPELTGEEAIERIEAAGYDVPVIVTSAYAPDSALEADDVQTYLEKPIDRENLFDAIDRAAAH